MPRAAAGLTGPLCRVVDAPPAVRSVSAWMRSVHPFCTVCGDKPTCPSHLGSSKHWRLPTQSPTPISKGSAGSRKEQRGHSDSKLHRAGESVDAPSPPGLMPAQYSSPVPAAGELRPFGGMPRWYGHAPPTWPLESTASLLAPPLLLLHPPPPGYPASPLRPPPAPPFEVPLALKALRCRDQESPHGASKPPH